MAGVITGITGRSFPDGFNSVEVITADTTGLKNVKGFMVEVTGTARLKFSGDTATVDLELVNGVVYPGSLSEVNITNSEALQKVYLLRYAPVNAS